ncbi:sensor histidine kinase [Alteribacillus sp. YIM 98480]|uniref:ATP-binding protein n=1 Tax=Alteribacillus sp. YIM 98480 TaxID=2606599 RepID=UPI00131B8D25|nr:sensor histidine kinase [Alteribacillus sp. YIM 98480]
MGENRPFQLRLAHKMILLIGLLITVVFCIMGVFVYSFFSDALERQVGQNALNVSKTVANMPEIVQAFEEEDPASIIQPLVTSIRDETGAEFVVVGNTDEIRYSHPNPERIGEQMIGSDNERALQHGEAYVSSEEGSLGLSIRGKTPIYSEDGEIIGVVSVGFLMENVNQIIAQYSKELWYVLAGLTALGFIGAVVIAYHIKRILFGLEPSEIAQLFLQKETILQSTYEGIIAMDQQGHATLVNKAAKDILTNGKNDDYPDEFYIKKLLPEQMLKNVLSDGKSTFNNEIAMEQSTIVLNVVPIFQDQKPFGAVASFHNKSEIEYLTEELSRTKQYTDTLRAQTHEFSNKLLTISGLLQMNQVKKAIEYIQEETNVQQQRIHFLIKHVSDPMIAGLLLGKFNQANELKVSMHIDPDSHLTTSLSPKQKNVLFTVLGNLIENAFEAVKHEHSAGEGQVDIHFTDIGEDIIFEVEDNGPGIPAPIDDTIFEKGFTTKTGENRGVGLALSKQAVHDIGGSIYIEQGELEGACFVLTLPKR